MCSRFKYRKQKQQQPRVAEPATQPGQVSLEQAVELIREGDEQTGDVDRIVPHPGVNIRPKDKAGMPVFKSSTVQKEMTKNG